MSLAQDDVIRLLIERRNELLSLTYALKAIPDKVNRSTEEVDALFECDGQPPLAIEHTRLETYRQQIRDQKVFERYVAPIEAALGGRYGDLHVGITLLYLRDGNWAKDLLAPLREWLDANLRAVSVQSSGRLPPQYDVPGVGVVWVAKREKTRRPGVYVSRTVPSNVEIPGEAVATMDKALAHKYEKLAPPVPIIRETASLGRLV